MWRAPEDDPRDDRAMRGEQETVLTYLRNYRLALEMKCDDLDAEQLARRSVPPSTMSLLGLVRHLAAVEHYWCVRVLQGREVPWLCATPGLDDPDFEGAVADEACVRDAWATWRRVTDEAEAWYAQETDWSRVLPDGHEVRDVLVHLVEEYARHVGHADLLRERVDGRTGQ